MRWSENNLVRWSDNNLVGFAPTETGIQLDIILTSNNLCDCFSNCFLVVYAFHESHFFHSYSRSIAKTEF